MNVWSTRRRDLYLTIHNTHYRQTSISPGGIRTRNPSKRAAADPCLRACSHQSWHLLLPSGKYFVVELVRNLVAHDDAREGKWRGNLRMEWVASTLTPPPNVVYPALLKLMRTPRLPPVDWTDTPTDLNGLVRFRERRNVVSARVPSGSARAITTELVAALVWMLRRGKCYSKGKRSKCSYYYSSKELVYKEMQRTGPVCRVTNAQTGKHGIFLRLPSEEKDESRLYVLYTRSPG